MIKRLMIVIIGFFLVATPTFASINTANLEGYWPLEETGFNYEDATSNNVDFNSNVATTQDSNGIYGFSQDFGSSIGSGGSRYISNTQNWSPSGSTYTFNVWVYPEFVSGGSNYGAIFTIGGSSIWLGVKEDGTVRVHHGANFGVYRDTQSGAVANNQWQMITLTWDGTNTNVYVNNVHKPYFASSGTQTNPSGNDIQIGTYNNGQNNNWGGNMDEMAAWDVVLDAGNRTALYNEGYGLFYNSTSGAFDIDPKTLEAGLERYYTFDSTNSDEQGNYNAVDVGSISYSTGTKKLGSASVQYNAQSEGKQVGALNSVFHGGNKEFTYNFWANLDTVNIGSSYDDWVINDWQSCCGYANTDDFLVGVRNGKWAILGSDNTGSAALQLDGPSASTNWDMVTVFRNSTHIGISVNGGTPVTQAYTNSISSSINTRTLGAATGYNFFGYLDEVGMWTRSLNSTEIACLYNSGAGLAYSDFNTCSASPANTNPNITAIADQVMFEDTTLDVSGAFTISDAEDPISALTLSYTSSNTTILNSTGAITFVTDSLTGITDMNAITPNANAFGNVNVTIVVTDTAAATNSTTFQLNVNPVNDAPTISAISNLNTTRGATNVINFSVADIDDLFTDLDYDLTYNTQLNPAFNRLTDFSFYNGANQTLTLTASSTYYGSGTYSVNVSDDEGAFATANFTYGVYCPSSVLTPPITNTYPMNMTCWEQDFISNIDTDIYTYEWEDFALSVDEVKVLAFKTTGNTNIFIGEQTSTDNAGNITFDLSSTNPSDNLRFEVFVYDSNRTFSGTNNYYYKVYEVDQSVNFATYFDDIDGLLYGTLLLLLFLTIGVASQSATLTIVLAIVGLFIGSTLVLKVSSAFLWIAGVVGLALLWLIAKLRVD